MQSDGSSKVTTVLMSKDEAEAITQRIRNAGTTLGVLLLDAYEREAWRALGYKGWKVYVEDRFDFTRQRSYQLMAPANANRQLKAAGSDVQITDTEARRLGVGATTSVDASKLERQVADIRAPLKDSKPKRGMQDKVGALKAVSQALALVDEKVEGHEDEEVAMFLSTDERKAGERALNDAAAFVERWDRILNMEVDKRGFDEWASA